MSPDRRALAAPGSLATLRWAPWWSFQLLRPADRRSYLGTLASGFARADRPLRHTLRLPPRAWVTFVRARGLPHDARANDLDVHDWIALQRLLTPRR